MVTFTRHPEAPLLQPETQTVGSAETQIRNVDAAIGLLEYRALEFRGKAFRVPPVSGFDGVRLLDILQRLDHAGQDAAAFYEVYSDLTMLAKRLLIPLGWRRYLWLLHIRPNPIRGATVREFGAVAGFLFKCGMSGPVRLQEVSPSPSTSSKTSASTARSTRRLSTRRVFH